MDKLKNPKVWAPVVAVLISIAIGLFADLKPIVQEICASVELKAE